MASITPRVFLACAAVLLSLSCDRRREGTARIPQRCVSDDGHVMNDWNCEEEARRPGYGRAGFPYHYHWYWGGPTSYLPLGAVVRGGTFTAPRPSSGIEIFSPGPRGPQRTGVAISPGTAAQRGLFGSSARAFGEGRAGE